MEADESALSQMQPLLGLQDNKNNTKNKNKNNTTHTQKQKQDNKNTIIV